MSWQIVCPDGKVRFFTYYSKEDAEAELKDVLFWGCNMYRDLHELQTNTCEAKEGHHIEEVLLTGEQPESGPGSSS